MFRHANVVAAAASLVLLAACSQSQQGFQPGASVPPAGGVPMAIPPPKNCVGANGVTVSPCPAKLTKHTKQGIVVTVSGPGVVGSYMGQLNGCFNGHNCYNAQREGSSELQWRITSGQVCGAADVEFDGTDAYGNKVGYYFLKVANKFCHRHRH